MEPASATLPVALVVLAGGSLAAWIYLVFAHGRFWLADQRLGAPDADPDAWPAVVAVVPARNEADVLGRTLHALLAQDYPGSLRVVLVDDESDDGTADVARATAADGPHPERFRLCAAPPRPPGWVGKMWAVHTGVRAAREGEPGKPQHWLWLTDADVEHHPATLRRLVARGERGGFDLVSLMVRLHSSRGIERLLIPAFVYFFQKLFPFPRVNAPEDPTAAAAGGCVLVRAAKLEDAGGIEAIRGEVIDDCALGQLIKRRGRIWLGLADVERSVRAYSGLGEIWDMVARSAYTQLGHSPLVLGGTLLGLLLLYAAPPALLLLWPLHGSAAVALLAGAAWLAMSISFVPTLADYARSIALAPALPLAGVLYAGMTLDSAWRHHRGRGAEWKGRAQAGARASTGPGGAAAREKGARETRAA